MKTTIIIVLIVLGSLFKAEDVEPESADNSDNKELDLEPSYFAKEHKPRDANELLNLTLSPSEDVTTSFKVISNRNNSYQFYLGEKVEVLLGFENTGSKELYITDICGGLYYPHEETQFAFNNTAVHHNITVRQNEYHAFYYPFPIDPHRNPINYGLLARIYYVNARGDEFSSVVVNVTLDIQDAPGAIKVGKFFFIILIIAVVVTFGIVFRNQIVDFFVGVYKRLKGTGRRSSGKRSTGYSHETDDVDEDDSDEWLKNTSTHAFQKQKEREKEKEREKQKKNTGGKRDISQSPNPVAVKKKRGRSPPSDAGSSTEISSTLTGKDQNKQ